MAWQWLSDGLAAPRHSDGSPVTLVQHVLVATRGWCCLVEGPTTDKLAPLGPCSQTQPLATQQICSLSGLSISLMLPRTVLKASCASLTPQDSVITAGLLAPKLCTGTSVVQMQLTGWGKAAAALKKKLCPMRLLPVIPGKAEVQYPDCPPPMGTSAA